MIRWREMFASVPRIPRWLSALDERKPYVEVLDGERLPAVSPRTIHGFVVGRLLRQIGPWADERGTAGTEIRFYFLLPSGRWSSLVPDVSFISNERSTPADGDAWDRPRIAPDLAVEVLSPSDRPGRMKENVAAYLAFGSLVVLVVDPQKRLAVIHRSDATTDERDARGSWSLEPFEGLTLDWDRVFAHVNGAELR